MPKIDYHELKALEGSIRKLREQYMSQFMRLNTAIQDFQGEQELDSVAWQSAKDYLGHFLPISDGLFNGLHELNDTLSSYLSAFEAEVGMPERPLDTDELEDLQNRLRQLQADRQHYLLSLKMSPDISEITGFNHVKSLQGMHELSHTVDLLERYQTFESNHARDFQSILDLLANVGKGIEAINQASHFSGGSVGYQRIDLSQQPWYNELINYNASAYEKSIPKPPDMAGATYVCESAALDFAATSGESSQICAWSKSGRVDQEALRLTKQYEAWLKDMYQTFGAPKEGPAIYLEDQLPTYLKELETGINSLTGEPLTDKEIQELKARVAVAWTAAAVTPIAEVYAWYGLQKAYGQSNQKVKDDIIVDGSHLKNGKLKSNSNYKTGEYDYKYKTDSQGRIKDVSVDKLRMTKREKRVSHNPNTPGKLPNDHAGHLVGDRFGGSPEIDNLVSQSSKMNQSSYKILENEWAKAIKDGKTVSVDVRVNYDGDSLRPKSFDITYGIDGKYNTVTLNN